MSSRGPSERMITRSVRRAQQVNNVNETQSQHQQNQNRFRCPPRMNVGPPRFDDDTSDDEDDDDDDDDVDVDDDDDVVELTASEFDQAKRHKSGGPGQGPLVIENESGVTTRGIETPSKPVVPVEGPKFYCPICINPITRAMSTPCGHIFCHKCIRAATAFQGKCPACRQQITAKDLFRVFLPTAR